MRDLAWIIADNKKAQDAYDKKVGKEKSVSKGEDKRWDSNIPNYYKGVM